MIDIHNRLLYNHDNCFPLYQNFCTSYKFFLFSTSQHVVYIFFLVNYILITYLRTHHLSNKGLYSTITLYSGPLMILINNHVTQALLNNHVKNTHVLSVRTEGVRLSRIGEDLCIEDFSCWQYTAGQLYLYSLRLLWEIQRFLNLIALKVSSL